MTTDKIFIGTEIEGPDAGILTMFIPRDSAAHVLFSKIIETARKEQINRFYFGAGDKTGLSENDFTLIGLLMASIHCNILIEVTLKDLLDISLLAAYKRYHIEIILVIRDELLDFKVDHIKFVNKKRLHWCKTDTWFVTDLNHKKYDNDKIIEL